QHRGVTIMPACVHTAWNSRSVGQTGVLLDGQGVHVGPQTDNLARVVAPTTDHTDDTRSTDTGDNLVAAPGLQLLRHDASRSVHLVKNFGMCVEVAAELCQLVLHRRDSVHDRHGRRPPSGTDEFDMVSDWRGSLSRLTRADKCDGGPPTIDACKHNNALQALRAAEICSSIQGARARSTKRR